MSQTESKEQTSAIVVAASSDLTPMAVEDLLRQVNTMQHVMKQVMQDGTHYGKIPGCGDKPSLYKAGAEKLAFVFRLAPEFVIEGKELPREHREYRVTCIMKHIGSGAVLGSGVGLASTMEGKYRFRVGPKVFTGKPVPKSYWDVRASNPAAAQSLLGGPGFATAKNPDNGDQWEIVEKGKPVEHDNPADYYNTVLKMAKKRAQVDATLTCTAASDIFTQDEFDEEDLERAREAQKTGASGDDLPHRGWSRKDAEKPLDDASGSKPYATVPRGTTEEKQAERKATESRPTSAPKIEPAKQSAASADGLDESWKGVAIHFGQAKDAKLGDLPTKNLFWWIENYAPKPFGNPPRIANADKALRAALDKAKAYFEAKKAAEDASEPPKREPAPAGNIDDEDVPF